MWEQSQINSFKGFGLKIPKGGINNTKTGSTNKIILDEDNTKIDSLNFPGGFTL